MKTLPYNITDTGREFPELLVSKKQQLNYDLAKNLQIQEQTLQVFRESLVHCDYNKFEKSKIVWNAAGYINVVSSDLKIIAKHLYSAELEWEKCLFGRNAALLIYKGVDDLFTLSGKSLKVIIDELQNVDTLKNNGKETTNLIIMYKLFIHYFYIGLGLFIYSGLMSVYQINGGDGL